MARQTKKHMSQEDKKDWDELYEYVKKILGYDENQALSKTMVLRLRGLLSNKFIANNNIEDTSNYSYKVVLNTFKFCAFDIQNGLRSNSFKDESHKFNYVLKIVESNLNTVYMKMKSAEKAKDEANSHDISDAVEYVNTFKSNDNSTKKDNKYNDLW